MEQKPLKYNVEKLLKPLRCVAKCLAIIPSCRTRKTLNSLHVTCIILLYLGTYTFATYGKVVFLPGVLMPTVVITDVLGDLTLTFGIILSIIIINLSKGEKEQLFLNKLEEIDKEFLGMGNHVACHKKRFCTEFIVIHVIFAIYYTYYCWVWIGSIGLTVFKYFFTRDLQTYHLVVLSLILRNYALSIRYRGESLNDLLTDLNLLSGYTIFTLDEDGDKSRMSKYNNVRRIKRMYTQLATVCGDYNELFGECFVILYVNIVVNLIGPANLAFVYGSGEREIGGTTFGWPLVVLCILWCSIPMINSWAIFSACHHCAAELKKTSNICYVIIQNLSNDGKEGLLKAELQELAQEASNTRPEFSAAGFFVVNYTVLFTLVGSVTAYLIVLLQFNR